MNSKARILVIDDDRLLVRIITSILEKNGFEVWTAPDGQVGLRKAGMLKPDLIILDVMMPEMDGYQVLRHLKAQPKTSHIAALMFTATGEIEFLKQAKAEGNLIADNFLAKPVRAGDLIERVKALLWSNQTLA